MQLAGQIDIPEGVVGIVRELVDEGMRRVHGERIPAENMQEVDGDGGSAEHEQSREALLVEVVKAEGQRGQDAVRVIDHRLAHGGGAGRLERVGAEIQCLEGGVDGQRAGEERAAGRGEQVGIEVERAESAPWRAEVLGEGLCAQNADLVCMELDFGQGFVLVDQFEQVLCILIFQINLMMIHGRRNKKKGMRNNKIK